MKIFYGLLLFVGYFSILTSLAMMTADFPSDVMMRGFIAITLCGLVIVFIANNRISHTPRRSPLKIEASGLSKHYGQNDGL